MVGDFDGGLGGGMDAAENLIRQTFGRIPAGRLPGNGLPGPLKHRQQVSLFSLFTPAPFLHPICSCLCA